MKCKKGYKKLGDKCVKKASSKRMIIIPESRVQTEGGIGFFTLLALLFIGLKLGKVIDWSWWWILAPIWIPIALGLILIIIFTIIWRKM